MTKEKIIEEISGGKAVLGIEFGSTRIKAVLINSEHEPVAGGAFDWENSLVDGIWTYSLDEIHNGITTAFAEMKKDVAEKYGVKLTKLAALGISAMMHGYLAFDSNDKLLVPFRTWRNTITGEASKALTELFNYPIPERWSIAHLYQAILNNEAHVKDVSFFTTLAGYVHWILTGKKVLGTGDASGMFPIDDKTGSFNKNMIAQFDNLVADKNFGWKLENILPEVLPAGKEAGTLTAEGAAWLDRDGTLEAGCLLAPPEGDAGTGMAATNSVAARTGNVSAGTSIFSMVVLEKPLAKTYLGLIDVVTTPDGKPVAMVHGNNCTGEYDKWIKMFGEAAALLGAKFDKGALYDAMLMAALKGDKDCGGCVPYNYISGESITGFNEGRPLFVRTQNASLNLANFMRSQLFTALAALRVGMDVLFDEKVPLERLTCHGGYFKTEGVGLPFMAAAMHTPVSAMSTAGEGGPWGMAVLAAYTINGKGESLSSYLESKVFASAKVETVKPDAADVEGFNVFLENYKKGLAAERAAVENL
ncbi:FGGY-family carbohydrate kinase [Treponema sp.]|uniref:xylulokinase n=1 Tax=Treponema sp. TaxID=166 RepID=UPI0025F4434A|nr:FGGY-family carbohydrate kinase [Treponema sp.]MCR5217846.1 ATPase [Treponema sp.]